MFKSYYYNYIALLLVSLLLFNNFNAQQSSGGVPKSFLKEGVFSVLKSEIKSIKLPYINNEQEKERADLISNDKCEGCKNNYYGRGIDVDINIKELGLFRVLEDESKTWTVKLNSSTAYGMEFFFNEFKLPEGGKLFIFNEERTSLLGAYTSMNNPQDEGKHIKFGTEYIEGKNIYLEYQEPANPEFEGVVSITKVIHIFENIFEKSSKSGPFGGSGSCNINVICPEGDGWANEINSVALILAHDEEFELSAWCSGSVINNTKEDGKPYFLTAKHCIGGTTSQLFDHTTWRFLFNHQTTTCNSDGTDVSSSINQSIYGSTLLSKDGPGTDSPTTDYLLLELNTSADVLKNMGVCYAGWTLDEETEPSYVGIHHPSGDVKKVSIDKHPIEATSYYSQLPNNFNHWMVNWDYGTTEGGSSGSPLFSSKHRIIGQLHGGDAGCNGEENNSQADWYGRFDMSWTIGNFSFWLDPYNTGQTSIDTYCPGGYDEISYENVWSGNYTPYCDTKLSDGFNINWDNNLNNNVVEVCVNENIILSPFNDNEDCLGIFPLTYESGCCDGNQENAYLVSLGGCLPDFDFCKFKKIWVSLTLCDHNLIPINQEYASWQYFTFNSPTNVTSFNLNDYLPSGVNFQSGQIYKLKLATTNSGTWEEYTRYIKFYSNQVNINGLNTSYNIYGSNISIQNSTISQPIEVVANNSITILPGTKLEKGHYYIDETVNCSSFKNKSTTNKNKIIRKNKILNKVRISESEINTNYLSKNPIKISPNPTKGLLKIEIILNSEEIAELDLKDLLGNTIFKETSDKNIFNFDLSKYPKGVYMLTTKIGGKLYVDKIIHQ